MNELLRLLMALAILLIVFRALEFMRPKALRTPLRRPGLLTDLSYWFFNPLIGKIVVRTMSIVVLVVFGWLVYGRIDRDELLTGFGPLSRLSQPVQAGLILIISDFIGYWVHRAFHGRQLWRFHAVHHSPVILDWISAARVHPLNEAAMRVAMLVPVLAFGFSVQAVAGVAPFLTVFALLLHANLNWDWGPFRSILASPRFHRWHHTSESEGRDKNFAGLLPVWDILFGTYYMPRDRVAKAFGTDTPVPDGLVAQLLFPFRR